LPMSILFWLSRAIDRYAWQNRVYSSLNVFDSVSVSTIPLYSTSSHSNSRIDCVSDFRSFSFPYISSQAILDLFYLPQIWFRSICLSHCYDSILADCADFMNIIFALQCLPLIAVGFSCRCPCRDKLSWGKCFWFEWYFDGLRDTDGPAEIFMKSRPMRLHCCVSTPGRMTELDIILSEQENLTMACCPHKTSPSTEPSRIENSDIPIFRYSDIPIFR
jgi:hypothetical protein